MKINAVITKATEIKSAGNWWGPKDIFPAIEVDQATGTVTVEFFDVADSKRVVANWTKYAQKGMFNIFMAVFFGTLACAFIEPFFFIGYLIALAIVGLYQAVFMANAGGAWDNAKKIVETELRAKGTALVVISHYLHLIESLEPDTVLRLDQGCIAETGGLELARSIAQTGFARSPELAEA